MRENPYVTKVKRFFLLVVFCPSDRVPVTLSLFQFDVVGTVRGLGDVLLFEFKKRGLCFVSWYQ